MSLIRLHIQGISYSHTQNGAYALILQEDHTNRKLPIVIGAFEAQSIALALEKELNSPRPLTHDLFKNFADAFSVKIKQVIIHKLVDGVFFSSMICEREGHEEILDARTSDAIAMAVRFDAPIFTYKNILDKAGVIFDDMELEIEEEEEEDDDDFNTTLNDFLNVLPTLDEVYEQTISQSPFVDVSDAELQSLMDQAIQEEDYEKAAQLRDELNKRNK